MSSGPLEAAVETVEITVDGRALSARSGQSVLAAALEAGCYIPHLCSHPELPALSATTPEASIFRTGERVDHSPGSASDRHEGCGLCAVEMEGSGERKLACETSVFQDLAVRTTSPGLTELRRERLARILATHPHACLTCAQKEGCSREPCSTSVPVGERCCALLGRCELEKVASFVGVPSYTPRYVQRGIAADTRDPLIAWNPELCIACLRCVRACGDLKGVGAMGFVRHDGETVVGLVAADRVEAGCRYCGACVEVCPTGALMDRGIGAGERAETLVPCRSGCPAGMDVPRFLREVSRGRLEHAAAVALDALPLPNVLSHVCFHPCENGCRRAELGGALSVCRVRRQVFESLPRPASPPFEEGTGSRRVAVIGAGPAGLAAAHFLRRMGHPVTVFEAQPEAGGMLRYGIPAYRLPRKVLQRDIDLLVGQDVEVRTGVAFGRDITLEALREAGFEAVLLAVGAGTARRLSAPGTNLGGVLGGIDFLREVATGTLAAGAFAGRTVLVVGGGNVALDAARCARRLGALSVTLACLESREEMPAYGPEIAAGEEEGVEILTSWGVGEILGGAGAVTGVRLVRCSSVFDAAGRFAPVLDPAVSRSVDAGTVILAIGQEVGREFVAGFAEPPGFSRSGLLEVDPATTGVGVDGVFACGDLALGPSSVVQSVASGRRAAVAIDRFLGGSGTIPSRLEAERPAQWLGGAERFAAMTRVVADEAPAAARIAGFDGVEVALGADAARREAARCLQCDLRLRLAGPVLPPEAWFTLDRENVASLPEDAGVYQLLGADHVAVRIAGSANLREALERELARDDHPALFAYEEDPMYSKRESELIQQHLALHGRMPGGDDELDDLF
jgi:formate dehydrogenase (NADP+) beta subunit